MFQSEHYIEKILYQTKSSDPHMLLAALIVILVVAGLA
jgi:hypothetical protein